MSEPTASVSLWKELAKDPLSYVIAIIIATGGYLMKDSTIGPTWYVGAGLIGFGVVAYIAKFMHAIYDSNFNRKYEQLIKSQDGTIKTLNSTLKDMSKSTRLASETMVAQGQKLYGQDPVTATTTTTTQPSGYTRL